MAWSLKKYLGSVKDQFFRYVVVGSSGVLLDIATLIFFKEVIGLVPVVAVALNQLFVLSYNFTLNKYWSFRNKEIPHRQIVRYALLAVANYLFSVTAMYMMHHRLGVDYRLVRIGTIMVAVTWNFFLYKYWVYKPQEA